MTLFEMGLLLLATAWGAGLGLRDGLRAGRGKAPEVILSPQAKADKPTPEQRRYDAILANIDAYDGTANGQKEVM